MQQYKNLCGWNQELAREHFKLFGKQTFLFKLQKKTGSGNITDGRVVKLWEYTRQANNGKDVKNIPQEIGDCVSWGQRNAIVTLSAIEIIKNKDLEKFKDFFTPYFYGVSRCLIGGQCGSNSDGSVGAWGAKGVEKFGCLFIDTPNCPSYSGSIAKAWGRRPPDEFVQIGKKYLVRKTGLIQSTKDAAESIVSGYPFSIAAYYTPGGFKVKGDKLFATSNSRMGGHQQACIGYDGNDDSFYIINSWGVNSNPASPDGAPGGGYWITSSMMASILGENDSYSYSSLDGFPEIELPKLSFDVI